MAPIIEMRNVTKVFGGPIGSPKATVALDDFSFAVDSDFPHIITIAGESGSGKTTMMMLILAFYEPSAGQILYNGKDIWKKMSRQETMDYRRNVQAVFQDPFAVYNPFYKVDNLLSIPIKNFRLARTKDETQALMESALRRVGLRPEETLGRYPHQLSGGQRQRIAVARALILQPKLLIADEPVSMVDASLRATLLQHIRDMNQELRIPILYITHDLTTAYHVSDYIVVLYRGGVMEAGDVERVIRDPKHPYTQLLVNSIPWPDPNHLWGEAAEAKRAGTAVLAGCRFADRCPHAFDLCWKEKPELYRTNGSQVAACFLYQSNDKLERKDLGTLFTKK
uniref:ABC transporter ATP-binding protein n=1 Tax=Anaerolinea thermolimosa TaxID=229919 RepID=A0A7C4KK29_9CHLR